MTAALPDTVPTLAESAEQPFHPRHQVRLRGFQQQMEMVADQHPRMHLPAMTRARLAQPSHEHRVIFLGLEDPLAPVTTGHHVIDRSGILEPQGPSHTP